MSAGGSNVGDVLAGGSGDGGGGDRKKRRDSSWGHSQTKLAKRTRQEKGAICVILFCSAPRWETRLF